MKQMTLLAACFFSFLSTKAQIFITSASLSYTQDFNSLDTSGASLTAMPAGWSFYEWGGSSANTVYRASTGSATSGDTYSYGAAGSTDRALGSLCSSGVPNVSYGVRFINKTTAFINAVTITYKAEQWRRNGSGKMDSVLFFYGYGGKTIADTPLSSWIDVPALLITSITTAMPAAATNGNDTSRVYKATIFVSLPAGDTISFRWYDYNAAGNDDGLSIDSLTMTFNIGPPSTANKPAIIGLSPAPNAIGVPVATNPVITFDKNIVTGSAGSIYIKDRLTQTMQTFAASSSNVTVSGRVATINGVLLQSGSSYHITFDSTAFDTAGFHCTGMYDTSAWVFATTPVGVPGRNEHATLPFTVVNPVRNGSCLLSGFMAEPAVLSIDIYDMAGRALFRCGHPATKGLNRFSLNTALPAGIYLIRLTDGKRWSIARVEMQ